MNRGQYLRLGFCFPPQPSHKSTFYLTKRKKKKKAQNLSHVSKTEIKNKQTKKGRHHAFGVAQLTSFNTQG